MNNNNKIKNSIRPLRSQGGFSVIELMVATVIGLIILSGAVTVFSSNKSSQETSSGMARVQQSGRVALDLLVNDIRMAGYQGCADSSTVTANVVANTAPTVNFPATAIAGAEVQAAAWLPGLPADFPAAIQALPLAGTDVIYVQHGSGRTTILTASMANDDDALPLAANPDQVSAADLVMIANCQIVDIFRPTTITPAAAGNAVTLAHAATNDTSGNAIANLSVAFQSTGDLVLDPLRVMRFEANAYYVADSGRVDSQGNAINSLFLLDLTSTNAPMPTELVEGVENIQFLYGERLEDGNLRYVTASDATLDMARVQSVQIGLLVNSVNEISKRLDTKTYQVADQIIDPVDDRRFRTAFNTTVRLRNRR